jgi:hypothetical protein
MVLTTKSPEALQGLLSYINTDEQLRTIQGASDAIGTLHFARLVDFNYRNQLGFLTVFDGDFRQYFSDFIKYLGPMFDAMFTIVVDGPPVPCAKNQQAFIDWSFAHNPEGIGFYSAYPSLSVQDIRSRARITQGAMGEGRVQSSITVVFPAKSSDHLKSLSQLVTRSLPQFYAAGEALGTLHFARFLPLGESTMMLIAEHDGSVEALAQGLSKHLGPTFDAMFEHVVNPPATSVQQHTPAFVDWISAHRVKPFNPYSAYPTLTVQDIRNGATARNSVAS